MVRAILQIDLQDSWFWTGSNTVLKYINNENEGFKTLVVNRIAANREASDTAQWHYIHTSQNPADAASRGLTVDKLLASKAWLTVPEFLRTAKESWVHYKIDTTISEEDH